ncbi:MerR family transcriptional regulator [Nocardioides gansuensis]|uniref:MerR family transcriptional regulator n=1 Tax=Nocardioides gansuensis TaxID=2138300 RepID=A0A2T8FGI6_9ACTN|nr:MerR family transcriptional regulator [Nocardioides gansuensis]
MEAGPPLESEELLTLEELTGQVGISVRNVRFYTSRGLVPPPLRRGRSGYYTPLHVARLELVRELQAHGFTLAAIERYVGRIPADATPADIRLHLALLAPDTLGDISDVPSELVELGVPPEAAVAAAEVYAAHGKAVAEELSGIVRDHMWPAFREAGGSPEQLRALVERLKPLTIASLVAAYEQAMDESARSFAERRAR